MPELPKRETKPGKGEKRGAPRHPYAHMAVCGLSMGLSWPDMRFMKHTHLMQLLWEYDDMNGAETVEVRDAGDADIEAMMMM